MSQPRRPHRSGEWTFDKAVTFIVTLAAMRSVTLAARRAGMSRKSAYALKHRDPTFAVAWAAAVRAPEGDKVDEVDGPRIRRGRGNKRLRSFDAELRDQFLSALTANRPAPVARRSPLA